MNCSTAYSVTLRPKSHLVKTFDTCTPFKTRHTHNQLPMVALIHWVVTFVGTRSILQKQFHLKKKMTPKHLHNNSNFHLPVYIWAGTAWSAEEEEVHYVWRPDR